jgi:hypothetical protein
LHKATPVKVLPEATKLGIRLWRQPRSMPLVALWKKVVLVTIVAGGAWYTRSSPPLCVEPSWID